MKHSVRKEAESLRRSKRIEEMRGVERTGRMDRVVKVTFGTVEDEMIDTVEEKNPDKVEVDKQHQSRKRKCRENETFLARPVSRCGRTLFHRFRILRLAIFKRKSIVGHDIQY